MRFPFGYFRKVLMSKDWIPSGREILDIEIEGLAAVRDALDGAFSRAVAVMAGCAGRIAVCGLGKSGLVGRKLAATFSSTGTAAFFLHPVEGAHGDLGALREEDIALCISYSGETLELNALIPAIKGMGCQIIALTGNPGSTLGQSADITLNCRVPREACAMNLAPTASTTATLALGDALAVCLSESKSFSESDFLKVHPGGALGQRLRMKAEELMHCVEIPTTGPETLIGKALEILDSGGFGAVIIVTGEGVLKGILTDGDVRRAARRGLLEFDRPVTGIMTADPKCGEVGQSSAELLDIMESKAITVLPVLDSARRLAGIIHLHDLLGKGGLKFA